MARLPKAFYVLTVMVLVFGLTACALPRDGGEDSDLLPVEALPPTLAPLGAENTDLAAEATVVPTVISGDATATVSPLAEGEAAPVPGEAIPPTDQPILLPATPVAGDVQQAGEEAAPQVPVNEEPIVVDATTQSAPADEPIAANPPASETFGQVTGYGDAAYTVQNGDTLFSIAQRYGTSVDAIMAVNGLSNDIVYAGQVLTVPSGDETYAAPAPPDVVPAQPNVAANNGGGNYVVARGETLFRIAMNHGTTVEAIASANGIPYPYTIYPGQQLTIPPAGAGAYMPEAAQPSFDGNYPPAPYSPQGSEGGYYPPANPYPGYYPIPGNEGMPPGFYPAPNNDPMAPGMGGTHTVAPGETLHFIAQRYGTSAEALANANGLTNPNQLYVGQVLFLP